MAKIIDWEPIERDWRAGIKTKQQISAQYDVSRAAMDKRFAKLGIARDLSGKIRAQAESLVTQAAVTQLVTPKTAISEKQIVDANAAIQTGIILSHRSDIQRTRRLTMMLLEELDLATTNNDLLRELAALLYAPDKNGIDKLNDLYQKIIAMPGRVDSIKKLSDTLKTLIALEREAFGIDAKVEDANAGIEAVIKRVTAKIG